MRHETASEEFRGKPKHSHAITVKRCGGSRYLALTVVSGPTEAAESGRAARAVRSGKDAPPRAARSERRQPASTG